MSDTMVTSSIRWTAISNVFRAGISFLQIIVLARLIEPSEFGVYAIVSAVQMFALSFSDAGISSAIIHFQQLNDGEKSSLFWWNIIISISVYILIFISAFPLSIIFDNDRITTLIALSSTILIVNALSQQIRALAERDMRFAIVARIEISSTFLGFASSVTLAYLGWDVLAIILSQILVSTVSTILFWIFLSNGWRPSLHLNIGESLPYVKYGVKIVFVNLLNIGISQADVLIFGRFVSPYLLGLYSQPRELLIKILTTINPIITRVGFPLMAKNKSDRAALARIYTKTLRMSASVCFPIFACICLLSSDLVLVIFGNTWSNSVPFMQTLAIWFLVRSIGNPIGGLLYAVGATRMALVQSSSLLIIMVCSTYVVGRYDPKLVPFALIVIHSCLVPIVWHFMVKPLCGATVTDCLRQVTPPMLCVISAIAAASPLLLMMRDAGPVRLVVVGSVGVIVYISTSFVANKEWTTEMRRLLAI